MSGGGGGDQLVGYWYGVGMHMVMCHGPVDELTHIMVGDKVAWSGSVSQNTQLRINQPNLFGGEEREGGIDGYVDIMLGFADQPCNDYLVDRCGGGPSAGNQNNPPLPNGMYVGSDGSVYLPDGTRLNGYRLPTRNTNVNEHEGDVGFTGDRKYFKVDAPGSFAGLCKRLGITGDSAEYVVKRGIELINADNGSIVPPEVYRVEFISWDEQTSTTHNFTVKMTMLAPNPATWIESSFVSSLAGQCASGYISQGGVCVINPNAPTLPGVSGFIPAFRGVVSAVLRQVWVAAMNPYIKPWSFRVRRYPATLGQQYMKIATDANPAAIIAECLTNSDWGLGYEASAIDFPSFTKAAQTLLEEGFGMSLKWSQQKSVDDFISHVLSTVDGYRYADPTNGKIGIRLARADYDASTLLVLDDSNVDSLQTFARPDPSDIINQVTINFVERPSWGEKDDNGNPTGNTILKNVDRSITVHNGASIDLIGQVNATSIDYPGIPNIKIAARVAMRELAARSRGLATVKLVANRQASQLKAGDVFKFNWPPLGISGMVLRVTEIDYGLLTDGRVSISAVEDAFSLPSTTYIGGSGSDWQEPVQNVAQISNALLGEIPYYVVATTIAGDNQATISGYPEGYAFLGVVAARPQSQAKNYSIWQKSSGQYAQDVLAGYTPYATLDALLDEEATTFTVTWGDLTNFLPNSFAFLGSEIVWITAVNTTQVTVVRAVFDTVPVSHEAGETLWVAGGAAGIDTKTIFLSGQTVPVRLQPRTSTQEMPLSSVAERSITFVGRASRPYPPGGIKLNDVYRAKVLTAPLSTVSWATRNRITQTAGPVAQTDASINPEDGATVTVKVEQRADPSAAWSQVVTASGLTGTSYTLTTQPSMPYIRVTVYSVRDGLESYQRQVLTATQPSTTGGYGLNYGVSYG
jgi:hypothetical protein